MPDRLFNTDITVSGAGAFETGLTVSGIPVDIGGGGGSGNINDINSQTGPSVTITGVGGINTITASNVITITGTAGGSFSEDLVIDQIEHVITHDLQIEHPGFFAYDIENDIELLSGIDKVLSSGINDARVFFDPQTTSSGVRVTFFVPGGGFSGEQGIEGPIGVSGTVGPAGPPGIQGEGGNPEDALTGSDGITIISGTSTIDVAGFRTEFVNASGSLSAQIDEGIVNEPDIDSINTVTGTLTLGGADGNTIVDDTLNSDTPILTVSGFRTEFVSSSGSLQTQIDNFEAGSVTALTVSGGSNITGDIDFVGAGDLHVTEAGQTITFSGSSHPYPPGFAYQGRAVFQSVTEVELGEAGILSYARDFEDSFNISWAGTVTGDITVAGAGGLDTGSESVNTFYAIYVIADSSGNNATTALLSISEPTPTMPAGYDKYRRLGWVRNNSSSNFHNFEMVTLEQTRRVYQLVDYTSLRILVGASATSFTQVSASSFAPPTTKRFPVLLQFRADTGGSALDTANFRPATDWDTVAAPGFRFNGGTVSIFTANVNVDLICNSSQNIDYFVSASQNDIWVSILGWDDPL